MARQRCTSIVEVDVSDPGNGPTVAGRVALAPPSSRSAPIIMVAVFCATLSGVAVIAVIDMLSPGSPPTAGERAPSWPAR